MSEETSEETKQLIYRMRQAGTTLAEIGLFLGISRQRVYRLLIKYHRSAGTDFLTLYELSQVTGYNWRLLRRLREQGIISGIKHNPRFFERKTVVTIRLHFYEHPPVCRICGRQLPRNRSVYCSPEHYRERIGRYPV